METGTSQINGMIFECIQFDTPRCFYFFVLVDCIIAVVIFEVFCVGVLFFLQVSLILVS